MIRWALRGLTFGIAFATGFLAGTIAILAAAWAIYPQAGD